MAMRFLVLAFSAMLAIAQPVAASEPQLDASGCATSFDPSADYFAAKSVVAFSDNFTVAYFGNYKLVTVAVPYPGGAPETYVLVQCGTPAPDLGPELADVPRITVPIRTLFSGSTAQSPALVAIDAVGAVTGVAQRSYIATPEMIAHIAAGPVVEYQTSGVIDLEAVIASRPDLFMAGGSSDAELGRIAGAGIPVVNFAEWLETSPLGRAEWVKFMALFFNAEAQANAAFGTVVQNYEAGRALVADLEDSDKPLVLSGQAFDGTFYAAGGKSFMAQFIADAGGRYVFADDTSTGSIQIGDPELLMVQARRAEFWIQAPMTYNSLADIDADDPRLAALPAARSGQVWIPDLLKGPNGGVQFYELGAMRPDIVLMDLISILHPDRAPGHERVFNRSIALP
jgi:iron complex transport system substrate-binding protein